MTDTIIEKHNKHVKVKFSPVGEGYITGVTERGYYKVNDIAVAWLVTQNNQIDDNVGYFRTGKWKLFIDDERNPVDKSFIVARTSQEAIEYIQLFNTLPIEICFDHDLGGDDTSMKFIHWMTGQILDGKYKLRKDFKYSIHSQNPVGVRNIDFFMKGFLSSIQDEREKYYVNI